jgi:uncharacterized lipoprotein
MSFFTCYGYSNRYGSKIEGLPAKDIHMKKVLMSLLVVSFTAACSGTGDRQYQMDTQDEKIGDTTGHHADDTTSTMNNSAYNTDSASGQGNRYDTSNKGADTTKTH